MTFMTDLTKVQLLPASAPLCGLHPGVKGVELLLEEDLREGRPAEGQHYQQLHRLVLLCNEQRC